MGEERAPPPDDLVAHLAGLDRQDAGALLGGVEVVEELLLGGPVLGDGGRLGDVGLAVGLGAELGQPVLHGGDARREIVGDAVHLGRHGVDLLAQLHQNAVVQVATRQPLVDGIERLLRHVEIARHLAGHLLGVSRGERQDDEEAEGDQTADEQKAAS